MSHRVYLSKAEKGRSNRREYCRRHPERVREQKVQYYRNLRVKMLKAYGGKCACCGELRYEFLGFEHLNGGGHQHRKQPGHGGISFLMWLQREHRAEIGVLCHNCNLSLGAYGYCPHKREGFVEM